MKFFLIFLIIVTLNCSTFKSKIEMKEKVKCSDKTLSLNIGYSETVFWNERADSGFLENVSAENIISKKKQMYALKNKFEKSCLFKNVEFNKADSDYTMEIFIEYQGGVNWFLYLGAWGAFFSSGYWIIPFNANHDLKLSITLTDNKTKKYWKKKHEEDFATWFHPLLIFTTPFLTVDRGQVIVVDNIVNSIVNDLSGKEFLYK